MKIYKNKKNKTDHFAAARRFINYLYENNIEFAISELTPMLFRFMADNGLPCSQPNVSKTYFYVKNYIRLKAAKAISVVEKDEVQK